MLTLVVGLAGLLLPPFIYGVFFLVNDNLAAFITGSRDSVPFLVGGLSLVQFSWAFQEARSQNKWLQVNAQPSLLACFGVNSMANMGALALWLFAGMDGNPWDALAILLVAMFVGANFLRVLATRFVFSLPLSLSLRSLKWVLFEEAVLYGLVLALALFLGGHLG